MWSPLILVATALISVLLIGASDAFTFTAVAGEKKCFTEELAASTRYEFRYKMAKSLTPFVSVALSGPKEAKILSHPMAREENFETITSHDAGQYTVCFNVNKKAEHSAKVMGITLSIQDERDANFIRDRIRQRDEKKLSTQGGSPSLVQATYIENSAENIHRDYQYLKQREADMRSTNEDTCTRAWVFTLISVIVTVVVTVLRHYKLKYFLMKKKILE